MREVLRVLNWTFGTIFLFLLLKGEIVRLWLWDRGIITVRCFSVRCPGAVDVSGLRVPQGD